MNFSSLLVTSFLFAGAAFAATAGNLLPNEGFENGSARPAGWHAAVWSSKPSKGRFEWGRDSGGNRFCRLIGEENAGREAVRALSYCGPIEIQPGLHRFTGRYRTDGDARAGVQIALFAEAPAANLFRTKRKSTWSRNLSAAPAWKSFAFDVNIPAGVKHIAVLLRETDIGTVDYDDISLVPVTAALTLRVYPAEYGRGGVIPVVRGVPSYLRFMLIGDRKRIRSGAEIQVDLPPGLGEFGLLERLGSYSRDGRNYTRFRLPLSGGLLVRLRPMISHCGVALWLEPTGVKDGELFYCRVLVDGRLEEEKALTLRVLPPFVPGPRPKHFHNFFCWSLFDTVPEKIRAPVYDMLRRKMGVDVHLITTRPETDASGWRGYFCRRLKADGGTLWANVPKAYTDVERHEKGWETKIVDAGVDFFARDKGYYRKLAATAAGAFWDWEPPNARRNPLWDDPATVKAFAEHAGLDPASLTPEILKGRLKQRFLSFRTWQLGQSMRLWAGYVHRVNPDWTIALCQGSGMPPERAVDYRAYNDIPNLLHMPMIYTSDTLSFARNLAAMTRYLPGAKIMPFTSTRLVTDMGWTAGKTPREIYLDYFISALLGCEGCAHWPDFFRGFDMEYAWENARAMRDIALVEPFLRAGERDPAGLSARFLPEAENTIRTAGGEIHLVFPQWQRHALLFTYRLGKRFLVAAANFHERKPAVVETRLANYAGPALYARDPLSGNVLTPAAGDAWSPKRLRQGLLYEVPAGVVGLLELTPEKSAGPNVGRIAEAAVRRRFERRCRAAAAKGSAGTLTRGGLEIGWADMDGDGNAEIHLASPLQSLGFSPSGTLWSWKARGVDADLVNRFDGTGACADRFWWPVEARSARDQSADYELVSREIKGGRAVIVFRRALTDPACAGLILQKAYAIDAGTARLEVRVTVRNESPEPRAFSYWSHNCFQTGALPALRLDTVAGVKHVGGDDQPRELWALLRGLPAAQQSLARPTEFPLLTGAAFVLGEAPGPRIRVQAAPKAFLQLYRWWDGTEKGRYTLEWMYRRQRLKTLDSWTTTFVLSLNP